MKLLKLLICSLFLVGTINAQDSLNMSMISNVGVGEIGNDVWGFVDGNGIEYAIMGSQTNTWIWSLEDPSNPIERAKISGDNSDWRDIKSWEDHIYVTADTGDDGLLVIDMSMAPDSIRFHYITPDINLPNNTDTLAECHNLYIDENGFCYLAGCRIQGANKAIVFDLNQDKWTPPIVGIHGGNGTEYAHDLYVKNNIMYSSQINVGDLVIYDVTQKDSIIEQGRVKTSFEFTHNAWTSNDQNYVFTTDERGNAFIDAYDVSDPQDIQLVDRYRPLETEGRGVIPHNTHYYDGFLVTSYYTDGVVVVDASRPENLIKVGSYDTFEGPDGGFSGCWGAFPFLPSGLVLASDRQTGLYVLNPEYTRASWLEGIVTDIDTDNIINGAIINIDSPQLTDGVSNAAGEFATGLANAGTYAISISHPDYLTFDTIVDMTAGVVTFLDVKMTRLPSASIRVQVLDAETQNFLNNASVELENENRIIGVSDQVDQDYFLNPFEDIYTLKVGQWGYISKQIEFTVTGDSEITVELERGYHDDFIVDLGWESSGDAESGLWERGIPIETTLNGAVVINPGEDAEGDIGEYCYVTGNAGGGSGTDDVDDGTVILTSPIVPADAIDENSFVDFQIWFVNGGGQGPALDTLFANVCNADTCVNISFYKGVNPQWTDVQSFKIADFISTDSDVYFEFITSDIVLPDSPGNLVEAGVDAFRIRNEISSSIADIENTSIKVYPNPFNDVINFDFNDTEVISIDIIDALGRKIETINADEKTFIETEIAGESGVMTLLFYEADGRVSYQKIIKTN